VKAIWLKKAGGHALPFVRIVYMFFGNGAYFKGGKIEKYINTNTGKTGHEPARNGRFFISKGKQNKVYNEFDSAA
jgi:hypothetical protein